MLAAEARDACRHRGASEIDPRQDEPEANSRPETTATPGDKRPLGEVADFVECCADHAWFFNNRWITKQTAVDNLQRLAELWDLIEEHGQDAVQALMAAAFRRVPR